MNGLIAFAVHRWQATLVVFALVAALGAQAFLSIPRSVDPQFIAPIVQVIAVLPGADPSDIEQTVVKPVEEVLAARPISWPLTLPMCAPISDGAAAAIVVSEKFDNVLAVMRWKIQQHAFAAEAFADLGNQFG